MVFSVVKTTQLCFVMSIVTETKIFICVLLGQCVRVIMYFETCKNEITTFSNLYKFNSSLELYFFVNFLIQNIFLYLFMNETQENTKPVAGRMLRQLTLGGRVMHFAICQVQFSSRKNWPHKDLLFIKFSLFLLIFSLLLLFLLFLPPYSTIYIFL